MTEISKCHLSLSLLEGERKKKGPYKKGHFVIYAQSLLNAKQKNAIN
jgi:hypothetical protein